jgi:hypothetical protein
MAFELAFNGKKSELITVLFSGDKIESGIF